jgi:hypothetical protein
MVGLVIADLKPIVSSYIRLQTNRSFDKRWTRGEWYDSTKLSGLARRAHGSSAFAGNALEREPLSNQP